MAFGACVLGAVLRVRQYAAGRSLWIDEASLAFNLAERDFLGLTRPMEFLQVAPLGWLWLERLAVVVAGTGEHALRFVPLVAGLAMAPATWWMLRRWTGSWGAAAGTVLVAVSPALVRYADEVKPYGSDALVTTLLLGAGLGLVERATPMRLAAFGAGAAAAMWFALPAVLVAGGVTAAVGVTYLARRAWRDVIGLAAASVVWLASFVAAWLVVLRNVAGGEFAGGFTAGFPPEPAGVASVAGWVGPALAEWVAFPGWLRPGWLGGLVAVGGIAWVARRRPAAAAVIVAPMLVAVAAAVAGRYPLAGRVTLYLVPVLVAGWAAAVDAAVEALQGVRARRASGEGAQERDLGVGVAGAVVGLTAVAVALVAVGTAATWVRSPYVIAEIRPVLAEVAAQVRPGDRIAVHDVAASAFAWYAPEYGLSADLLFAADPSGPCLQAQAAPLPAPPGRRWLVFAYTPSRGPADLADRVADVLGGQAEQVVEVRAPDAAAFAFEGPGPGTPPTADPGVCVTWQPMPNRWVDAFTRPT